MTLLSLALESQKGTGLGIRATIPTINQDHYMWNHKAATLILSEPW
jgi:hypothetical protein